MTNLPTYAHEIRPLSRQQLKQLLADLNQARVANRRQGGSQLSYLEAWDVKATLIRVFGFGGFSSDVLPEGTKVLRFDHDIPAIDYQSKNQKMGPDGQPVFNWRVTAQATLRLYIHQLGATYTETAISSQTGPDVGEVGDFAIKTAESDALKRAAINLGTQFGLSLYNDGSLGDVVRVLLNEGEQMVTVQSIVAQRAQAAQAQQGGAPAQQAPAPASAPQAPQADDDAPMALAPSDEAQAAAQAKVNGAFGG